MRMVLEAGAIVLVALGGAVGTWWIKGPPARVLVCDPATLKSDEVCLDSVRSAEGILWVDARSRGEWRRNGVPGSALWNLDPAEDAMAMEAEAAPRVMEARKVVVYCGDEQCGVSRQIADRIRKLDFGVPVVVLRGGWRALDEAGLVKGSSGKP